MDKKAFAELVSSAQDMSRHMRGENVEETNNMPITRKFRETIWARAQGDSRFRAAMLTEAINELLSGDLDAGKAMLCCTGTYECRVRRKRRSGRDDVNATITFDGLAKETGKPSKSLQRMLGPRGNPTAESLFAIIKVLQDSAHIRLAVSPKRAA